MWLSASPLAARHAHGHMHGRRKAESGTVERPARSDLPCQFNTSDECQERLAALRGGGTALSNVVPEIAAQLARTHRGIFIDCGANRGDWLVGLLSSIRRMNSTLMPFIFPVWIEPSRQYYPGLQRLAKRHGGRHIARAAWVGPGTMAYHESRNSASSSLMNATASRYGVQRSYSVDTFDLAAYVASFAGATVVMKHDIEASEYTTLPHLVATGAHCHLRWLPLPCPLPCPCLLTCPRLCPSTPAVRLLEPIAPCASPRMPEIAPCEIARDTPAPHLDLACPSPRSFLSVEWHLSALPQPQRLVALAFEHALPAVLSGCRARIYYEGQSDRNMNQVRLRPYIYICTERVSRAHLHG